jgi:hypothetical protein
MTVRNADLRIGELGAVVFLRAEELKDRIGDATSIRNAERIGDAFIGTSVRIADRGEVVTISFRIADRLGDADCFTISFRLGESGISKIGKVGEVGFSTAITLTGADLLDIGIC